MHDFDALDPATAAFPFEPMNGQAGRHDPVLLEQAIEGLALEPGEVVVDGTFGAGGHSRRIVEEIAPDGVLIAVDRDPAVAEIAAQLAAGSPVTVHVVTDSYANIAANLRELGFEAVDGILLDLGLSSIQLDDPNRGFSFTHDGPLDMRFDPTRGSSAADLVSGLDREELANLIYKYGEERQSRRIASAIVRAREREPIRTTGQLAAIVEAAVGGRRGARIHPATRTFQALRIAVNDELGELERGLTAGIEILRPGGRFVVIAFHSLEDRIVKQTFQREIRGCICPPEIPVCRCGRVPRLRAIGKPVRASDSEIERNPRSRSAIMRVVERLP